MKAHDKVVLVLLAAIILIPASGLVASEGSEAADNEYTHHYRDQLTHNQSLIYDAMTALDPSAVEKTRAYGGTECYAAKVCVPSFSLSTSSYQDLRELVLADIERAWQATLLDDPFAWWTWSSDNAGLVLFSSSFKVMDADGEVSGGSVDGLVFFIWVADIYMSGSTMAEKVAEAGKAMDELFDSGRFSGDSPAEIVRSINSYLCSQSFVYDTEAAFSNNIYGALVAQTDGKHAILCAGYSQLLKAACDRAGIPCINVVGLSAQTSENGAHMWNQVVIHDAGGTRSLAVDSTWNATGGSEKAYLLLGSLTVVGGATFTQTHQAFAPLAHIGGLWVDYGFSAPVLDADAYPMSEETDIFSVISEYMPWVFAGVVCIILSYVLWTIGRKGE